MLISIDTESNTDSQSRFFPEEILRQKKYNVCVCVCNRYSLYIDILQLTRDKTNDFQHEIY